MYFSASEQKLAFLMQGDRDNYLLNLHRFIHVAVTYPRKSLVSLSETPYYHVVARCVRRAWLWGFDAYAGRDYSHRKRWVLDRLAQLASVFTIDVCAYAIMSNHYHLVLHVDRDRAQRLSTEEVVERWTRLFREPEIVKRWRTGNASEEERGIAETIIEKWRNRLYDLSWFMKCMNEYLARRANAEDGCDGRFWHGRFKSQALLDVEGLLTAMAYVDLNPVRAGVAVTPETSEYTSVYERIKAIRGQGASRHISRVPLLPFRAANAAQSRPSIPFELPEYLQLVDWTGRVIRQDKRGYIDRSLPAIMCRLQIDPTEWRQTMRPRGNVFGRAIGRLSRLRIHASALGQHWISGLRVAQRLYA